MPKKRMSLEEHSVQLNLAMQNLQDVANSVSRAGYDVVVHVYDSCSTKRGSRFRINGKVSLDVGDNSKNW